ELFQPTSNPPQVPASATPLQISTPLAGEAHDLFVTASPSTPTQPPAPEPSQDNSPSRRPGWDWIPREEPAPKNISLAIDPANILTSKRRANLATPLRIHQPSVAIAMVALAPAHPLDNIPRTYRCGKKNCLSR
ncbi:hypothetical protein VP01_13682g1, partial [Puccinia sorghi]